MKRLLSVCLTVFFAISIWAVPAKPGQWVTLTLADGTEVLAQLCGDEHVHFWTTSDGQRYVASGDIYIPVTDNELKSRAMSRRTMGAKARKSILRKTEMGTRTHFTGKKKGIVILVEYTDVSFKEGNDSSKYNQILNQEDYHEGNFVGSVYDYFKAQSNGQFELLFDVVGPFTLKNKQSYYGANDSKGSDMRAHEMIVEACQMADEEVNFADYDWDGDGEADQVFVLYAGRGEADGGGGRSVANTVWPHMWTLTEAQGSSITLDSTIVDTYACSNEINGQGQIQGIGTFCHEFSHCMGFPDFYDISYSGNFGMSAFDLMNSGSYNGNGFLPACYTAHEKMMCGWKEPIVLDSADVVVDSLLPISEDGNTYIIYNNGHPDEYFMIENRQFTGFDEGYPGQGLLITYVDFDKQIWQGNMPNTIATASDVVLHDYPCENDHQRMTLLHADNNDDHIFWNSYGGLYIRTTLSTDLYPYLGNDSVTATSVPAPTLYNADANGKKTIDWAILNIHQNSDKTMGFTYRGKGKGGSEQTVIKAVNAVDGKRSDRIYTPDGRFMGTKLETLPRGLYIVNGKKIIR